MYVKSIKRLLIKMEIFENTIEYIQENARMNVKSAKWLLSKLELVEGINTFIQENSSVKYAQRLLV